jgi:predicted nucleic acid-binding Zn ribbon protein
VSDSRPAEPAGSRADRSRGRQNPDEQGPSTEQSDESWPTRFSTPTGGELTKHVENLSDEANLAPISDTEPRDLAHEALAAARRSTNGVPGAGTPPRRRTKGRRAKRGRPGDDPIWSGPGPDARDPQRLGSIASTAFADLGWKQPITEARVFTDWANLVGGDIASHCRPSSLRDGELRLEAQSTAWATQIRLLSAPLLARLATELGAGVVKRISVTGPTAPSWRHGYRTVPGARGPRDTYG